MDFDYIQVNDQVFHAKNSEGNLIHNTPRGIYNFWKWFGRSKVVDKQGRPLVVYHAGGFDEFPEDIAHTPMHFGTLQAAQDRAATKAGDDFISEADVFYDDEEEAWFWESEGIEGGPFDDEEEAREDVVDTARNIMDNQEEMPYIGSFYLRIEKPKRVRDAGEGYNRFEDGEEDPWEDVITQYMDFSRYDGLVYKNQFEDRGKDSWIIFYPEQVKSLLNVGSFSKEDSRVRNPSRRK